MTTPTLAKRKIKDESVKCPTCGRYHWPDSNFGPYCCASCLQVPIRPLIVEVQDSGK